MIASFAPELMSHKEVVASDMMGTCFMYGAASYHATDMIYDTRAQLGVCPA